MTTREDLQFRQSLGAEFLDEQRPEWRSLITRPIDIADYIDCVGAQIMDMGDYHDFLEWVWTIVPPDTDWDIEHGFECNSIQEAKILNELWTAEVESA